MLGRGLGGCGISSGDSFVLAIRSYAPFRIGSNLIHVGIHQAGGKITPKTADRLAFTLADGFVASVGEVRIPARPCPGISAADAVEMDDLATGFFDNLLEGNLD